VRSYNLAQQEQLSTGTVFTFHSADGLRSAFLVASLLFLTLLVPVPPALAQGTLTVTPATIDFGSHYVGSSTTSHVVTITNTGTVAVNLTAVSISGTNAGDFTEALIWMLKNPLPAGGSCTINVRFWPSAAGTRTAILSVSDNASGSPQTVTLTGVGVAAMTPLPSSLTFANQNVGTTSAASPVTLTNNYSQSVSISSVSATGDFAVASNTCTSTLAKGAQCVIGVSFAPTAAGVRTGTLSISDTAPGSPTLLALSGTGVLAGDPVTLAPTAINFGNHYVGGTTASQVITITNTGTVAVNLTAVSISGANAGDFTEALIWMLKNPLPPGGSCTINVRFWPSGAGTRTATLSVSDSASGSPQTVTLTGVGLPAITTLPASLTFADQSVGTKSAVSQVMLTNNYSQSLSISSISASGDFVVASNTCPSTLAKGAQCVIGVSFAPTAAGVRSGTLSISNSAPGSPTLLPLSGTAILASNQAQIQHVIVIFQENRSTDNLFQDPVLIGRGADIASSGLNSAGQIIALTPMDLGSNGSSPQNYDLDHSHLAFTQMYDGGKMDGADKVTVECYNSTPCPLPNSPFKYVLPSDVGPYFQLAEQYTFADRMFQTNQGGSFPAHQFIISGTSAPTATSNSFDTSNVAAGGLNGCIAPPGAWVAISDPFGKTSKMFPCFEHPTLTDLLENAGISWRYYTPSAGGLWTGPNAIEHMCGPNVPPPNATACVGADWTNHVVINTKAVLTDIANGKLASVSWVMPTALASDHAAMNDGSGPSWVASVVNAIGASPYWSNTAIFITWDDWGGWYDHVAPRVVDDGVSWGSAYVYGFRVPLIVVSPYAKAGYISHVTHDFGSILSFVEHTFDLPSLGYADAYADDLSDCFDFNQTPLVFQKIGAPMQAADFLKSTLPETGPDDD
jgi:phospholipase C